MRPYTLLTSLQLAACCCAWRQRWSCDHRRHCDRHRRSNTGSEATASFSSRFSGGRCASRRVLCIVLTVSLLRPIALSCAHKAMIVFARQSRQPPAVCRCTIHGRWRICVCQPAARHRAGRRREGAQGPGALQLMNGEWMLCFVQHVGCALFCITSTCVDSGVCFCV